MGCFVSIHQSEVGIKEKWGVFQDELQPGLYCLNPISEEVVGRISTRLQTFDLEVDTKSKENTFCKIKLSIHVKYREDAIRIAHYAVVDANKGRFLSSHVTNIVRGTIPTMTLEDIYTSSTKLASMFRDTLNDIMAKSGIDVLDVLILDINPDQVVRHAMNAMNAAERDRITAISVAEANKITLIKKAEGEAEARHLSGIGISQQRSAITEGLAASMSHLSKVSNGDLDQAQIMNFMLNFQYYDMMRDVGTKSGNSTVIYLPAEASDMQKAVAQQREAASASMVSNQLKHANPGEASNFASSSHSH